MTGRASPERRAVRRPGGGDHRGGPGPGPQPRGGAGPPRRRHRGVRPGPRSGHRGLPAGHGRRPGRDGAPGRGPGPALRVGGGRRAGPRRHDRLRRRGPWPSSGSVDILVANAGISTLGSICTMDAAQWSETIDTNLTGVFNAMRAAAPHMRRQRWGRIIGISSMMGRSSNPGIPAYVASKWGVIGLCKSVAFELAAFGVTVNAVAPGNVSTADDPQRHALRPDATRPRAPDPGGRGPGHGLAPRPARSVARARGDHRRRGLPGLGGGPPHHRLGHRRGRRGLGPVHRADRSDGPGSTPGRLTGGPWRRARSAASAPSGRRRLADQGRRPAGRASPSKGKWPA